MKTAIQAAADAIPADDESISLLFRHEQNERGMIRSLLDFGLKPWDDQHSVADYILERMRGTLRADRQQAAAEDPGSLQKLV